MFGNCQAQALRWLLRQSESFTSQYSELPIAASYEMDAHQCKAFCDEVLPNLDLLIVQPHNATISPFHDHQYIRQICARNQVQVIAIPQVYFSAYNPWERNLDGLSEMPYDDEIRYMDTYLVSAVLREVPLAQFLDHARRLTDRKKAFFERELQVCFSYLSDVEQTRACNVFVSEFIRSSFRSQRVMHSINHPCANLMSLIATAILNELGIYDLINDVDLFGDFDSIIYPAVAEATRLEMSSSDEFISHRYIKYEDFFSKLDQATYKRIEAILQPHIWIE